MRPRLDARGITSEAALAALRRRVLTAIRRKLKPIARKCGYGLLIVVPIRGRGGDRLIKIPGTKLAELAACWAISTDGPITDAYGGGCVVARWRGIPVEDLIKIDTYLSRAIPAGLLE